MCHAHGCTYTADAQGWIPQHRHTKTGLICSFWGWVHFPY